MYLGYDSNGNIITKDPSGERGEYTRPLLNAHGLTGEEAMGLARRMAKAKKKAMLKAKEMRQIKIAAARAKAIEQRKKKEVAARNAKFLKGVEFSKSGKIYTGMGGTYGDSLTPHHVSGEVLANTFISNYGLNGADFGRGQMGFSFTTDNTKKMVKETYQELLRIEKGLKDMSDALSSLERAGKKGSPTYSKLKSLYDLAYSRYHNLPVSYQGKQYSSRRGAGIDFGLKLRDAVAKKDAEGAKYLALMFAAPLVYEQQVKEGRIKQFSGYGFGSEFDQGMGFIPLLGLAAWQVAAAALGTAAVGGAAYAVLSKDKILDKALSDSQDLIAQALKEGKIELATQLIEREKGLLKQKEKQSEGIVEKGEKIVGIAGSGVKIAFGVVALIAFLKIGMPLLQSKASSVQSKAAV